MKKFFEFALGNVARHGDTDVFPFPVENRIFFDLPADALAALDRIHKEFDKAIHETPPIFENALSVAGYNGFRPASQLDPLWNAYLLGLVSSIGSDIEQSRVPSDAGIVYSYRVRLDKTTYLLFDPNVGWTEFQKRSIKLAGASEFVLCCDISDFYPRIYHHQLKNALDKTKADPLIVARIMRLLSRFSGGVSYGLPVGGPAARLLSELLLNRTDKLLLANKISFCRFVDDYRVFAKSKADAYQALLLLSRILSVDEGLTLQRNKTRIMSRDEYVTTNPLTDLADNGDAAHAEARSLLRVRLRFDPYSPTAEEDYDKLKEMLGKYDIVGMLAREVRKSRMDESLTRKLIKSIKYLDVETKQRAVLSLLDNLEVLYPLFGQIMIMLRAIYDELNTDTKTSVQQRIRELIANNSYIICVPTHMAYALRLLAQDNSVECDALLADLYKQQHSMMIRRDIILAMARHNADYWLSNCRKQYTTLTEWEKTAMVIASFVLGDEGDHWRKAIRGGVLPMAELAMKWAGSKLKAGAWEIPL